MPKVSTYQTRIIAPDGTLYTQITNLYAFCEEFHLDQGTTHWLVTKAPADRTHRGWRKAPFEYDPGPDRTRTWEPPKKESAFVEDDWVARAPHIGRQDLMAPDGTILYTALELAQFYNMLEDGDPGRSVGKRTLLHIASGAHVVSSIAPWKHKSHRGETGASWEE